MAEHYTRNTESVTRWCNTCQRDTQHSVSSGRVGRCLEHEVASNSEGYSQKQLRDRERRERERRQPELF
jgi:hypothetical protein